jgi:PAS domain S-box-containing protein
MNFIFSKWITRFRLSLKWKVILGLGGIVLISLLVMGWAIYDQGVTLTLSRLIEDTAKEMEHDAGVIQNEVTETVANLRVVSETPPISGIIRAWDNRGIDPLNGDKTEFWFLRLRQIFAAFIKNRPEYLKLRLFDKNGKEIIWANTDETGAKIKHEGELQGAAERALFAEAIKLDKNNVCYSELELGKVTVKTEISDKLIMKIATPIYGGSKQARGVLMVDVDGAYFFAGIRTGPEGYRKYVINKEGYFLYHPDKAKELGFGPGTRFTINNIEPELMRDLQSKDSSVKYHAQDSHIDGFRKIYYDAGNKNHYWALSYIYPQASAFKEIYATRNTSLVVAAFIIIISLTIIILFTSRKIISPILSLVLAAEKLEGGNLSTRVPEEGQEQEFQTLYRTINAFAASQQRSMEELEQTIAERTTEITEANIKLNKAQEIAHLGSWEFDHVENRLYWSDEVYRIFGIQPQDFGATYEAFMTAIHPDDRVMVDAAYLSSIREEKSTYEIEHRIVREANGDIRIVYEKCDHIRDGSGRIVRSIGMVHDITERKAAENKIKENEQRLHSIIQGSPIPAFVVGEDHRIIYWNKALEVLTGVSSEDVVGTKDQWKAFYGQGKPCTVDLLMDGQSESLAECFAGKYKKSELAENGFETTDFFPNLGNGGKWLRITSAAVSNSQGRIVGGIESFEDITELKNAKEAADAATQAKSMFLASMSHEIRTPLNAIIGMAEILAETPLTQEQSKYVQISKSAGETLLCLINDILDFSKIEAGQLVLDAVDFNLADVIQTTHEMMAPGALGKGLEIIIAVSPDIPKFLRGDSFRLTQVLINLIGNAIKFTEKGEIVVTVSLLAGKKEEGVCELEFSIRDTGIGIPQEKLETVFEEFTQVDSSTTRKYGGTGLGLSISKKIINLMGGRIWVESELCRGGNFRFTVVFTISEASPVEEKTTEAELSGLNPHVVDNNTPPPAGKSIRILLAEDTENNRLLIQSFLKTLTCELDIAENGRIARDKFRDNNYDIVLMDIQMPEMDGYEATGEIRRWEKQNSLPHVPIIALTAYAFKEDIEKALNAGCNAHLTKPIKKSTLLDAIRKYIGQKGGKNT